MRQSNKAEMTITEQLRAVCDDFCDHYCKWPEKWDEEKEGIELSESEHCINCPLQEIGA